MRIPKRLVTWLYVFGLLLVTLIIIVAKPAQSSAWSSTHDFPVASCVGYEVWSRVDAKWQRRQFYSREDDSLRVRHRLEDWDATYYNRRAPDIQIHHRATGIGDNLELTLWFVDDQVVRSEENGNPFRVAIPDIGTLVLKASRDDDSEWNRFEVVPEGDTESLLCAALAG
jgi:hypothetical protein